MTQVLRSLCLLLLLSGCVAGQSPLDQVFGRASVNQPAANLSTAKISAGLKEALQVSTTKAVELTGRPDGFLKNEAIRIALPDTLRRAAPALRMAGMGTQLDDLEVGMNRAAEQATPQAKRIFLNALKKMSIADARQILSGGNTAATDYFKDKSSAELRTAFTPIVHSAMQRVGVIEQFGRLTQSPMAAPFAQRLDIDGYVVGKTLDGLFYMLSQQEKQIRSNPAARTTALLKQVFGARSRD